jgi:eukaryotic-like serine/threonine-protein kinase
MKPSFHSPFTRFALFCLAACLCACQASSPATPATASPQAVQPFQTGGTQVPSEKDGMQMVFVPAGEFWMGSSEEDLAAKGDEKPQHKVYLDAFWIDRTEVTIAMYNQCVHAGTCQYPYGTSADEIHSFYQNPENADYPINTTWTDAGTYCRWAGRHLPSEAEWEKAARGTDGRLYPWGNTPPGPDLLNFNSLLGSTTRVGSYPGGASPYGALDMAGNLWEWVTDWYDHAYYVNSPSSNPTGPAPQAYRACRGGSWNSSAKVVRAATRGNQDPGQCDGLVGIRCSK